MSYSFQAL